MTDHTLERRNVNDGKGRPTLAYWCPDCRAWFGGQEHHDRKVAS